MPETIGAGCPELERSLWILYRDFFDKAEKKRRWSIRDDVPWDGCNRNLDPCIADVVESFCAVELYLPDYVSKVLPVVRASRGRTWFYANWGYEESKHSLVLGDWLLKSGQRTEEEMADMEDRVFQGAWNLPDDSPLGMLVYAMVQELATFVNYRNLRARTQERGGDPALERILHLVAVDEKAHHSFFQECVELFLKYDRPATLEQLRRVMNYFSMPAINDLADGQQRIAAIRSLDVFGEEVYFREVYFPLIAALGVSKKEMRDHVPERKSAVYSGLR